MVVARPVQRCGVGGAQEEEPQYLVCSSAKRALAPKTQRKLSRHSGRGQVRRRSGDESVVWPWPLARGLTSGWEIPHGDSFTSRCLVVDAVDPAGARAPQALHAPCGARARPVTSIRVYRACNCKRTVTGRRRGPVRSPHSRPGQSERAAGPGRATRVRTTCARAAGRGVVADSSGGGVVLHTPDADGRKRNNTIRAERPPSVSLARTGSKKQLLHAIDNALG